MSVVIPSNTPDGEILPIVFPKLKPLYELMLVSSVEIDAFAETVRKYLLNRL